MHPIRRPHFTAISLTLAIGLFAAGCGSGGGSGSPGALLPPATVTATPGPGQVTIQWSLVSGATSYNLYWDTNPGVTKATGNPIPGAVSPFDHTGLTAGTTYHYVVTAMRGTTEGPDSVEVSATPTGPSPPVNITAAGGNGEVTITWSTVPAATAYNLYWDTNPGVTRANGTQIPNVTSPYVHTGLMNGTTYYYVLTSVEGTLEGVESVEVSARPLNVLAGTFDPTFGGTGWVTFHDAAGGGGLDRGRDVTIDAAGRILVVGFGLSAATGLDMVIWRINSDGSPDVTFDGQGWVVHDGAAGASGDDLGWAVTLDGTGRILATGWSVSPQAAYDMIVWRYNDDGSLDTTFGVGGIIQRANAAGGNGPDQGWDIAVDSQDRIVVAGHSLGAGTSLDMVLWRFDATGATDLGFGTGGVMIHHDAAGGDGSDEARSIAFDPSDGIIAAGQSTGAVGGNSQMVIWKLDASGALDPSFGTGGIVTYTQPGDSFASSVRLDSAGRIVVAGYYSEDMAIWRYAATGQPDPGFGAGGIFVHDNAAGGGSTDLAYDLVIAPGDIAYTCGYSVNPNPDLDMVLWAVDDLGVSLPPFGTGGFLVHHDAAGGGGDDSAWGIALDASGRIVAAGESAGPGGDPDMAIWRVE